jgi:hypothetical protein
MRSLLILPVAVAALAGLSCSSSAGNTSQNNAATTVVTQPISPADSVPPVQAPPPAAPADSLYTDLNEKVCKDVKRDPDDEGIIYKAECPGTAGYRVISLSTDHTQGLIITDPSGKRHDVDFRGPVNTMTDVFLGDKVEWRTRGAGKDAKPHAFIIRVNVQKEPGNYSKQDSLLAVVKIAGDGICVTDLVRPRGQDQNATARELADSASSRPCIKSDNN